MNQTCSAIGEHLANNHYFDRKFGSEAVKVLPGEYFVTTTNMLMVTVLGSCVAACIRDREKGIGGMNHFMLANDNGDLSEWSTSTRYGAYAMEVLINHLLKLGARRSQLEAKVFGGGHVIDVMPSSRIGENNARFVRKFLATEGISVVAQDLLDVYPRKVYFFPESGRVLVKKLIRLHNDTLIRREREYAARLGGKSLSGAVELF